MVRVIFEFCLECLPLVAFYLSSFELPFLRATAVYVACTAIAVFIIKNISHRVPYISLIFGAFVIGGGMLSILFHEPHILIIADTIYFFLGAAVIAYSLTTPRSLIERLFDHAFDLTPHGWRILSYQWIGIFILAGISNEIARITMSPEWWIGFQFWRANLVNAIFFFQFFWTAKHRIVATTNRVGIRSKNPEL